MFFRLRKKGWASRISTCPGVYYDDVAVQWADGTVHSLYTRESSLATSQYGYGQTNSTIAVETSTASGDVSNLAQTTEARPNYDHLNS